MGVVAVVGEVGVGEVVLVGEVGEVVVVRKEIVVGELSGSSWLNAVIVWPKVSQQGPASLPSTLVVGSRTAPITGGITFSIQPSHTLFEQ
ncbi:unnamed protein product [Arctogadus glacialis]